MSDLLVPRTQDQDRPGHERVEAGLHLTKKPKTAQAEVSHRLVSRLVATVPD
jgi:hypothetical protein